ncbi:MULTISPECIES: hypothetical protein [Streptacidiphilus]|uniref:Secreted protein n=1 Tax=Streptacidiphilus cavernicola TaxID=3342716 RepID=A0ABV6UXC0_9ACTN|nr:hypothetical protein [Streptacidiphilus jeojiense]
MFKRTSLRIVSAVAGVVIASAVQLTPASAATGVDGFTILYASVGGGAHHCEEIGSDQYGNQAIVCADLYTQPAQDSQGNATYPYHAWAVAEAYCQNSSGVVVQCANITVGADLANAAQGIYATQYSVCGHSNGACPAAREYAVTSDEMYSSSANCSSEPNSSFDAWGLVAAGGTTVIELPQSAKNVTLGSNYSTGHYYICM